MLIYRVLEIIINIHTFYRRVNNNTV